MALKAAESLVNDLLDEIADEEAENQIIKEHPGIEEILQLANDAAPHNLIDQILLDDIVDNEIEKVKRCPVPYDHLEISCNEPAVNGEEIHYLFDESEYGAPSGSGTSKWLSNMSKGGKSLNIIISVKDEYSPIILTHYALKSANDALERDPKHWKLFYFDEDDRFVT